MSIKQLDGTIIHMPFPGHRTMAEVWEKERARQERARRGQQLHRAKEYGLGG